MNRMASEKSFGCLLETGGTSLEFSVVHAGVIATLGARSDDPRCLCETECSNIPNWDHPC